MQVEKTTYLKYFRRQSFVGLVY